MKFSSVKGALNVLNKYFFYLSSQRWDKEKIKAYQDRRLVEIVRHAAVNVPYYRNLFQEIGFDPDAFRGREDMHKIPLLDKQTLRTRQDEFIAENAARFGINWDSTSGSTGTPLHLIIDDATKAHKLACVIRSYQWAGYTPPKKTFSIQSYTFEDPQAISKRYRFANMWRFNSKLLKRDTAIEIARMISDIKPKVFIGYPFSMLMISRFAREEGIDITSFESIVTAGETLSERRRKLLEEAYQCKVFDFFSHHEDVAVVTECPHNTKHFCEDFAYNEVVDQNGDILPEGKTTGELVGTGFYNFAMPLIRYRVGDTVILNNNTEDACSCGRQFSSVKEIVGRQNDYLETPDGRFLGNVLEHAVDNAKGVVFSQCVQDAIDHIYVNMITDETFVPESTDEFEKGLRIRLGNEIKIDFKVVDHLEKSKSGKTPFIMSKIGHDYV